MKAFKCGIISAAVVLLLGSTAWAQGRGGGSMDQGSADQGSMDQGSMDQGSMDQGQRGGVQQRGSDQQRSQHMKGQEQAGQQQEARGRFGSERAIEQDHDKVMQIQRQLNQQEQANLKEDGKWGNKTEQALRRYQQKEKLPVSGKPDQQTLQRLGIDMGQQGQM